MKTGVYEGLSFDEYKAIPALNASGLKELSRSPLHYWSKYVDPNREPQKETPALRMGKIIHTAILEPEHWESRYIIEPEDAPRRPSSVQRNAKKPSPETLEAIAFWDDFNLRAQGREILSREEMLTCARVSKAVWSHPAAEILLKGGRTEVTLVWNREVHVDGAIVVITCKARIDFLKDMITDVKSAEAADLSGFGRSAASYDYPIQAAWYVDGYASATGEELPFIFGAFEKEAPNGVAFYEADDRILDLGRRLIEPLVVSYAKALNSGQWHGYPSEIQPLSPGIPAWYFKGHQ
jgi:exodeoxyribonuclease VIII